MASIHRSRVGFTLIELLVVIAIIAILTAILLPVFFTVQENSRQSTSMSNMKDIQQKMEQFKLDNHRYPDVLFGYAFPSGSAGAGTSMKNALSVAQAAGTANIYFPGLYPAYIRDYQVFTDQNNIIDENNPNQATSPISTVNLVAPCDPTTDETLSGGSSSPCTNASGGTVVQTTRTFYTMDAYDTSPQVTAGNQVADPTHPASYVLRYQLFWGNCITDNATYPGGTPADSITVPNSSPCAANSDGPTAQDAQKQSLYTHQLYWKNPPSDTYVTLTTHHVVNADKVLVLFDDGSVHKMRAEDFQASYEGGNAYQVYNFYHGGA